MFLQYTTEEKEQLRKVFPSIAGDFMSDGLYPSNEVEKIGDDVLAYIQKNMPHILPKSQQVAFLDSLILNGKEEGLDVMHLIEQRRNLS